MLSQKIGLSSGNLFPQNWDGRRTLNIALIRAALIVPFIMWWYKQLGEFFPGSEFGQVIRRVILNELVGGPVMIALVFIGNALLRGEFAIKPIVQRFRNEFWATSFKGVTYWPIIHLCVTFRLPVEHQPLFAHIASIYWNGVLSFHAHKTHDD